MTSVGLIRWGPGAHRGPPSVPALGTNPLNDADNKAGVYFQALKSGSVDRIGFTVTVVVGTPPAYKIGIYPVTASTGLVDLTAPISEQSLTISATGPTWVTLSTPADVTAGEIYALMVSPGATAPTTTNYATLLYGAEIVTSARYPYGRIFTTAWGGTGAGAMGVLYDDDTVACPLITSTTVYTLVGLNSTPDEIGIKFQLPFAATCVGIGTRTYFAADGRLKLYSGASVLANYLIDISLHGGVSADVSVESLFVPVSLAADTDYRLVLAGEVATANRYGYLPTDAASIGWFPRSDRYTNCQRTDGGAWDDTNLYRVPNLYLLLSDIETSAAAGGVRKWASMG